jgi:hypothetical protein
VCVAFSQAGLAAFAENLRTFEFPADFDHIWEWHTGSKVETDKFDDQSLDG